MKIRSLFACIAPLLLSVSAHAADATLGVAASVPETLQWVEEGKDHMPTELAMTYDPASGLKEVKIPVQIRSNAPGLMHFFVDVKEEVTLKSGSLPSVPLAISLSRNGGYIPLTGSFQFNWANNFFPKGKSTPLSANGFATSMSEVLVIKQKTPGPLHAGTYSGTIRLVVKSRLM